MEKERRFYIPMTSEKVLCSIADREKIDEEIYCIVRKIAGQIKKTAGTALRSVVLRGSVAYGGFHRKLSDLDLVIFLWKQDAQIESQMEALSVSLSRKYSDIFSLVDLSVEAFDEIGTSVRSNRLWLNLKLTGITVEGEDLIPLLPECIADYLMAEKIFTQTILDSEECLKMIKEKRRMYYMGMERGSEFLCVWYMRNMIRGFTALILRERGVFTMHLTTCCYEMAGLYPRECSLIEEIWSAERNPISSWESLYDLAERSLTSYRRMWEEKEYAEKGNTEESGLE